MFSDRQLKSLFLPLFVEQLLVILVGMADTVMVANLGDAAVSGVSLVDMICVILISLFAALATGGAVVTSQMLGAHRNADACRTSNQLMVVVLVISVIIMGVMLALGEQMLRLLYSNVESDVMAHAVTYLRITALSYPFIALYNAGAALFRSMNNSRVTMMISILVNLINITGNAILIYGVGMGVEGVAIPTLVSRVVGALVTVKLLRKPNQAIHFLHGAWRPNMTIIRDILRIGMPSGLENSLFQLGRVLVVRVITVFGTVQIAANAVANTMDTIGCLPGQAMNLLIISVVGQCVGARDYEQARYYIKKLLKWDYVCFFMVNIPVLLALRWILPLFKVSPETLALASVLIFIHNGVAMLLWPIAFTLPNALRAASDVRFTMYVAVGSMAVFRILFSYILGLWLGWGATGVWIAMVLDWICRLTFYIYRYRSGKWVQCAQAV